MPKLYIGLVHYPIYNKHGEVITTALTNYDIHDIARSATTYAVTQYFIIHPVPAQRALATEIMAHWQTGAGSTYNPDRKDAFAKVTLVAYLEDAIAAIELETGCRPCIITTDARTYPHTVSYADMRRKMEESDTPWLLLFGTGYGMTEEMMKRFDYILEPIIGAGEYNHLCVRSAAAIILDRLLGEPWWEHKEE